MRLGQRQETEEVEMSSNDRFKLSGRGIRAWILVFGLCSLLAPSTFAQQLFTSGSTGQDGALDFCTNPPAQGTTIVFNPATLTPALSPRAAQIYNFTTICIPAGITVMLSGQILNGPVWWLSQGNVTINGTLDLSGQKGNDESSDTGLRTPSIPGPGGYSGGTGTFTSGTTTSPAQPGNGPGGGAILGNGGTFSGNSFLVPLVGGSGGAGINPCIASAFSVGPTGGAGGGALVLASSSSITVNGSINANGGNGGVGDAGANTIVCSNTGGGGSGGAIRLVANTIGGSGTLSVAGGNGGQGTSGATRLEAFTLNFTGSFSGPFTEGAPASVFLPTIPPTLQVTSVNGVTLTQPTSGSLQTPDATINSATPVTITIQTTGIPPGTVLTLLVYGASNGSTQAVQTTALQGTLQSATASASAIFPSGLSLKLVKATWTQ